MKQRQKLKQWWVLKAERKWKPKCRERGWGVVLCCVVVCWRVGGVKTEKCSKMDQRERERRKA